MTQYVQLVLVILYSVYSTTILQIAYCDAMYFQSAHENTKMSIKGGPLQQLWMAVGESEGPRAAVFQLQCSATSVPEVQRWLPVSQCRGVFVCM